MKKQIHLGQNGWENEEANGGERLKLQVEERGGRLEKHEEKASRRPPRVNKDRRVEQLGTGKERTEYPTKGRFVGLPGVLSAEAMLRSIP